MMELSEEGTSCGARPEDSWYSFGSKFGESRGTAIEDVCTRLRLEPSCVCRAGNGWYIFERKLGESLWSELENKHKPSLVTELGIKVTPVLEAVLCRELEYVKCAWKIYFARHWGSARLYSLECHLGHRLVVSLEGHLVQSWKDNSRNH